MQAIATAAAKAQQRRPATRKVSRRVSWMLSIAIITDEVANRSPMASETASARQQPATIFTSLTGFMGGPPLAAFTRFSRHTGEYGLGGGPIRGAFRSGKRRHCQRCRRMRSHW